MWGGGVLRWEREAGWKKSRGTEGGAVGQCWAVMGMLLLDNETVETISGHECRLGLYREWVVRSCTDVKQHRAELEFQTPDIGCVRRVFPLFNVDIFGMYEARSLTS